VEGYTPGKQKFQAVQTSGARAEDEVAARVQAEDAAAEAAPGLMLLENASARHVVHPHLTGQAYHVPA